MAVISGLGIYLPQHQHSAADIAQASGLPEAVVREKLGIHHKYMPGPDDHTNAMGVHAARAALLDAGAAATDLNVYISITEEHKEYPMWTSGIKAAHDIGATNAFSFDIGQKCGTAVLALRLATDMIRADGLQMLMIAGGYRNGDLVDYSDPNVRFLYNLAAGGGAAVVSRDGPGFEILGSAFHTDGSFSEDVLVPVGGTRAPLNGSNSAEYRLQVKDIASMRKRLAPISEHHFVRVAKEACARSDVRTAEVAYAAVLHMKPSAHRTILDRLGIPADRSIYLSDYGHLGQIDPLLSLKLARDQGRLNDGDVCLLLTAGIGYVWNAMCVRYREK